MFNYYINSNFNNFKILKFQIFAQIIIIKFLTRWQRNIPREEEEQKENRSLDLQEQVFCSQLEESTDI